MEGEDVHFSRGIETISYFQLLGSLDQFWNPALSVSDGDHCRLVSISSSRRIVEATNRPIEPCIVVQQLNQITIRFAKSTAERRRPTSKRSTDDRVERKVLVGVRHENTMICEKKSTFRLIIIEEMTHF